MKRSAISSISKARTRNCLIVGAIGLAVSWGSSAFAEPSPATAQLEFRAFPEGALQALPGVSPRGGFEVELQIDDGTAEGQSGVNGAAASQFLWFSQFAAQDVELEEIHVLFPPGDNMSVGGAVQLVVYTDDNTDPTDGATLVATLDGTIQAVDGTTFSVFPWVPAVSVGPAASILVGVVPRFINSGVTSPTFPAAIDTSSSQGQSWVAIWSGDPPASPSLPSDGSMPLVNGNWMIRAFGSPAQDIGGPTPIEVPVLDRWGLTALAGLLLLAGITLGLRKTT